MTPSAAAPPLVLQVLHHLQIGGMENGLVNLINHMSPARYRHAIVCIEDYDPDFQARLTRPGVAVHAMARSRQGVWRMRVALYRLCRILQPALVHTRNLSGLDALLPARLAGVPCVHSEHGWDVDNLDGRQWKPLWQRRLHAPLIDATLAVSRHLERFLIDTVHVSAAKVTQVYNGVDTARFTPHGADARAALPAGFERPEHLLIGTVGRLQAVKDQATLLRAFATLRAEFPQARLVIAGDGPLRGELQALAAELQLSAVCAFLGASDRIPDVLRSLDLFVLPSLNEGISNTILEAMASALPVVATAAGGNVELVDPDVTGRLFAPRDEAALAMHLRDYLREPALRAQHSAAARQVALARFSLTAMVEGYAGLYDRVLARRHGR